MIRSFKGKDAEALFHDLPVRRFQAIERPALRKLSTSSRSWITTERCLMASRTKLLVPIPPGEILREEFMGPLGLSINSLARSLAVPADRISGIVNGTRAISADTALRLGKYFGTSPEIWLGLQSDYELRVARQTTWKQVERKVQARVA